ncbi:MAG: ATP-binding protein [Halanaerobiaceae bacterium]
MTKLKDLLNQDFELSTSLFEKILNNCHDDIWLQKADYTIYWANKPYLEKTGYSPEQLANNPCFSLLYNKKHPCSGCLLTAALKNNSLQKKTINTPEGKILKTYCEPFLTPENPLYIHLMHDLTREENLNRKLNYEMMKTNYFTSLSHEFRTPLNLMHSTLQLLDITLNKNNLDQPLKQKLKKYNHIIKQNNFRLIKLVNNILDINKMDLGYYEISLQNRDIVRVIKDITESSWEYARNQNKDLIFKTELKEKIMALDPFEIERVLLNLISNALKFTEPGDKITVSIKQEKENVIIEVKDTGLGIPGEKKDLIFQQFRQAGTPLSNNRAGSGLGLYIVKLIIEMHNGSINVSSEPGQGSCFTIKLPVKTIRENTELENKWAKNTVDRIDIEFSDIYC